jgi:hypothetical protein
MYESDGAYTQGYPAYPPAYGYRPQYPPAGFNPYATQYMVCVFSATLVPCVGVRHD